MNSEQFVGNPVSIDYVFVFYNPNISFTNPASGPAVSHSVYAYLIAYNVLSAIGWTHILIVLLIHLFDLDGKTDTYYLVRNSTSTPHSCTHSHVPFLDISSHPFGNEAFARLQLIYGRAQTAYFRVGTKTALVQSFAVLEVAHVIAGWVRSPLSTTAAQVASRLFLVWGVTEQFVEAQSHPLYLTMVLAWSLVEVIRYSFYALNLAGYNTHILLWLRYTAFYILYPLGASSEASLIYASLQGWQSWLQGMWTLTNYVRTCLFVIWWPGFYVLYTYMIAQRRRVLASGGKKFKSN